ncbi:MAG: PTS system transporter subunit IIA [Acidobacteria bacterium OLB17]|nr:MAG: PTS system transporter subunit IIA [Acidobacteria bacterium OLB17]MCZ2392084.1 PTS sugar transporter subunit IIA [Acidobacteriota bacterium]
MDDIKRIGAVIVSHGQVANELLAAAEAVVGDVENVAAVSIGWHDDVEAAKAEIERAIEKVSDGVGVILLTDMFGGTPTNISAMFLREGEVEIISGVNLPMVVKVATIGKSVPLADFAKEVEEQGKSAIMRAGDLLEPRKLKKDA